MKNYFNTIIGNNGLWVDLKKSNLESLLKKVKEQEKKFEWLQTTKLCNEASDLALKEKYSFKAAKFQERLGFCFYKAADQAGTIKELRNWDGLLRTDFNLRDITLTNVLSK